MGSGGAIWGISEVLTLRTTPTSVLFRCLAGSVSIVVIFKSTRDGWKKKMKEREQMILELVDTDGRQIIGKRVSPNVVMNPLSSLEIQREIENGLDAIGDNNRWSKQFGTSLQQVKSPSPSGVVNYAKIKENS
jgi:hypothetical protein